MGSPSVASAPRWSSASDRPAQSYLRGRMALPQRHRLLHGYPLAAATPHRPEGRTAEVVHDLDVPRGLLVGVLPHPFCNPAVTGCGFCTFPHEAYHADRAAEVVEHVVREIDGCLARQPGLASRRIAGLYFGGGTANLTPADPFRRLCRALAAGFDLADAEVTLEGVPAYFVKRKPLLIDILREEIPARHVRISMGVQTFDEGRLRQMGRLAFGTADTFAGVVRMAHARGCTASADLLFNLPGQTRDEMRRDVEQALRLDIDHLGLYHLVMFRGLGTAWSRDPALLAGLPTNEQAAENWLALRRQLLEGGFVQTSLTNFERARYPGGPRRFVYEEFSFQPDRYDMAGFGPGAISFSGGPYFTDGLKTLNPDAAAAYVAAVRSGRPPADRLLRIRRDGPAHLLPDASAGRSGNGPAGLRTPVRRRPSSRLRRRVRRPPGRGPGGSHGRRHPPHAARHVLRRLGRRPTRLAADRGPSQRPVPARNRPTPRDSPRK